MLDSQPQIATQTVAPARARSARDPRLDVFRGLCLVMIFINHVPGNVFEDFTSRNFGFSDAAEGFVLMSGIAAGLAYGRDFQRIARLITGLTRVLKRVWTIYLVHILTTVCALAAAAATALWLDDSTILFKNQMGVIWSNPLGVFIGIPALTHQFGYVNILPLYLVLLLASPVMFIVAWKWPLWLMGLSVALWAATGWFRLNLPNYPNSGGWFFNPLAWQVIFACGLLTGVAIRDGRRFVPVRLWLQLLSGGFLVFACLAAQNKDIAKEMGHLLWMAKNAGAPWFLTDFDKTFVTAPRLLHILALGYFLSTLAIVRRACALRIAAPLAMLGRHSLPVFALGSVLAIGIQGIKQVTGKDLVFDSLFLFGGLSLQFALAASRHFWPKPAPQA